MVSYRKKKELRKELALLSEIEYSQIFFIPAIKINFYFKKFKEYFSGRKIMIAKEMTKIHETFQREDINNLNTVKSIKGEFTVVISEKISKEKKINKEKIVNKIKNYLKKYSVRDTVNLILETEKVNKKEIYQLCLKIKNEKNN